MKKSHNMNYTFVLEKSNEFNRRAFIIRQLPNCANHIEIHLKNHLFIIKGNLERKMITCIYKVTINNLVTTIVGMKHTVVYHIGANFPQDNKSVTET